MKTVYKYLISITDIQTVTMPAGAVILHADTDPNGKPALWAYVDIDKPLENRLLTITGTGRSVPDGLEHLASFVSGPYVWHVWEQV